MADVFTPSARSRIMAAVRSRGNASTERAFATALRRLGIKGWRRHLVLIATDTTGRARRVRPDFVFHRHRLVVFVHGCFWHGCSKHASVPKTNAVFWRNKIRRNKARDLLVLRLLRRAGWRVVQLWEHDTKSNADACARRIAEVIGVEGHGSGRR